MLAGFTLALLAGEVSSRSTVEFRYAIDPDLGHIVAPGSRFRKWGEGNGSGVVSEHGARVWPHGAPQEGRVPVLVLGDSYSEAFQVSDEELFTNRMGALLESDGLRLRVSNVGHSGYSMADFVCRAAVFDRLFSPEWVVVQINAFDFDGDAFAENSRHARFRRTESGLECIPPTLPSAPPVRGPVRSVLHGIRSSFGLPDALWARLGQRIAADDSNLPLFSAGQASAAELESAPKGEPPVLEELKLLREAWGSRVTLLYLPAFEPSDVITPEPIERSVADAAARLGIRFRSLREEFPAFIEGRVAPYGFSNTSLNVGHWNAEGHAAGARVLHAEFLSLRAHGLL